MKKFSQFVAEYRMGNLDTALAQELQALVQAVQYYGKAGALNLKISVTPKADGELQTIAKFEAKVPRRDTIESIMFATLEGDLLGYNPKQGDMFNANNVRVVSDKSQD